MQGEIKVNIPSVNVRKYEIKLIKSPAFKIKEFEIVLD
jgi:hypothetical protein